jgi:hypothetical protein
VPPTTSRGHRGETFLLHRPAWTPACGPTVAQDGEVFDSLSTLSMVAGFLTEKLG